MKPQRTSLTAIIFEIRWIALLAALFFVAQYFAQQKKMLETLTWWAAALAFASWLAWFAVSLYRRKREGETRERFKNYFSPQIVDGILGDHKKLELGGERREVSIMFTDIRAFTRLSENLPPKRLIELLEEYFTEMTMEIEATGGVVDKFIGDAIMAFWGAPVDQIDKADRAVTTAMGMMKKLKMLNARWQKAGYPPIDIGIGIHTGVALVGNIGSRNRFDYTVIGDDVNIASRLEGLNRDFKTNIIISESTRKNMTLSPNMQPLGDARIRGRKKAIKIYSVAA